MALAETITKGINNPDCAFFVGNMYGESNSIKIFLILTLMIFILKLADKLVAEPFIDWIKNKRRVK